MTHLDPSCWTISHIENPNDGAKIRYGMWSPKGGKPKRFLLFSNGRKEWLEKYSFLTEELNLPEDTGFLTWDHRGQGASDGFRAHIERFETFAEDLQVLVQKVVGNQPYVVMGHSMGGLIATYAALRGYIQPESMAFSAPLFKMPNSPLPRWIARPAARLACLCGGSRISTGVDLPVGTPFGENPLTHWAEGYEVIRNSAYNIGGPTFGWVDRIYEATALIFEEHQLRGLPCSVLVIGGSEEKVVDPDGFSAWVTMAAKFSDKEASFKLIPGAFHEVFFEVQNIRSRAFRMCEEWFGWN